IEWEFWYYDVDDIEWEEDDGEIGSPGSSGSFEVPIPKSASKIHDGHLFVWANDSSDKHSDAKDMEIEIGGISASVNVLSDTYMAGDFVRVSISASIFSSPLKNGDVHLDLLKDDDEIAGYTVENLKTDIHGKLTYIFKLESGIGEDIYTVFINVTKSGTDEYDTAQDSFEVVDKRDLSLVLKFDNKYYTDEDWDDYDPRYYSGDTMTVTYIVYRGGDIVQNLNCVYTITYSLSGKDYILEVGTTTAGQFTYNIPADFDGSLTVEVEVKDTDGASASREQDVDVDRLGMILNPDKNQYLAGDTITIEYYTVGTPVTNAGYYYEIADEQGGIIVREELPASLGKFQFTVPSEDPHDSYNIRGYVTDSNGVIIAESHKKVTRLSGFMITFTLDKSTYMPGDTATLKYKIYSLDGSDFPESFTLTYYFTGGQPKTIQTSDTEGSLKLKVPEDAPDGTGVFNIYSSDLGSSGTTQVAEIRESPNPLAETIADMPLLSLILLVLVILALIFGIIGFRRGKKALEEAKLPPWKKEGPLPEAETFQEPESTPPPPSGTPSPSGKKVVKQPPPPK
ncbi:MAG: hypothetical protein JSV56_09855, partial [Methanomassiliicoccales archaeon]